MVFTEEVCVSLLELVTAKDYHVIQAFVLSTQIDCKLGK